MVHEEENSKFNPVKLHLKSDLVLHPAFMEGLGNLFNFFLINNFGTSQNFASGKINGNLKRVKYPFIVITSRFILIRSGNTCYSLISGSKRSD